MKRLFLLILSFIFLGGAVSSSAFYISSSLNSVDTQTSGGGEFSTSENENLDDVTANAPTNSGLWIDSGNYATSFAGGSGTETNPYLISTPQQLARLSYLITYSNSTYRSLYYKQTANLDMSAYYWSPIGTSSSYTFRGYFDGGNFTISNIYVNGTSYQGLFGYTSSANISNVNIDHFETISTSTINKSFIGSIIGYALYGSITNVNVTNARITRCYNSGGIVGLYSSGTISYCSFSGEIEIASAMYGVGGIVGTSSSSLEIFNCHNYGNIEDDSISNTSNIGGIVGRWYVSGSNDNEIYNCTNSGNIISAYGDAIGGIVGRCEGSTNDIYNCYNSGTITGQQYIGGIVGHREGTNCSTSIYNCYNTGDITASDYYCGGIVGYFRATSVATGGTIDCCYNTGNITARTNSGGISGYGGYSSFYIRNCFNIGVVLNDGGVINGYATNFNAENCYYVSSSVGSSSIWTTNCSVCTIEDAKNLSWYLDSSNWYSSDLWDFENTWGINSSMNDGYPILVPILQITEFTITYYPNGASGDEVVESKVGSESYTIRSNMFTRTGYNFTGWNTEANGGGTSYTAGASYSDLANLDLYAQWSRITYTITYNKNASDATGTMANTTKYYGTNVTLRTNAFTRTGYTFLGWATSANGDVVYSNGATYTANASVTLYAKWDAYTYYISFNGNGSTGGSMSSQTFRYGTAQNLTSNAYTKTGFTFAGWNRNADGTGTSYTNGQSVSNLTTSNGATITLYAQWRANNEAKYDSAGGYWYIENGAIPQTRVTSSSLISSINNSTTTTGSNYYIAGLTLQARVYNGTEYCQWNGSWYEVEPIKWRLDASSSQTDGYGTTTDTNAVLAEIVYIGQYSSSSIDAGEGYSSSAVTEFMRNGISTTYLVNYATSTQTFGTGSTLYGTNASTTARMFVSSQSEITSVVGNMNITFSDLVEDMIKYYGGTNVYFTRDLGSNYNNIVCFNEVGREVQRFATDYRGVQFTVRFTEYGCVA